RVAILRRKSEERGARFEPGVLEAVAQAEVGNVRELMGALNRLVAFQAVNDTSINAETVKRILGLASEGAGSASPGDGRTPAAKGGGGGGGGAGSTGRGPERISRPRAVERGGGRCGEGASGRRAAAGAVRGVPARGVRRRPVEPGGGQRRARGPRAAGKEVQPAR